MGHLYRPFTILVSLLLAFMVIRWYSGSGRFQGLSFQLATVPITGAQFGRPKGESTREWVNKPMAYQDTQLCASCHGDKYEKWRPASHKTVACETCHGAGRAHVENRAPLELPKPVELCLRCHEKVEGRPVKFPQITLESHALQKSCVTCHDPHSPKISLTASSGVPKVPHALEGRSACLACHGPGGLRPVPATHVGRTNEMCLSCHKSSG